MASTRFFCYIVLAIQLAIFTTASPFGRHKGDRGAVRDSPTAPGVCCRCAAQDSEGNEVNSGVFLFQNTSKCSLTCCQNWNSSYTVYSSENTSTCSSVTHKTATCSGNANCYCNTLSYPDRVSCCAKQAPQCKFLQAYYPTRPQGLCVRNRTLLQESNTDGHGLRDPERLLTKFNNTEPSSDQEAHHTGVGECPGCSSNPSKAACELIHGCCVCCSVPNPCQQSSSDKL